MTVLSSIRNRAGLLVAIIGIALLAFILGDIFSQGGFIGNKEVSVGEVNGDEISAREFDQLVNREIEKIQIRNGGQAVIDEQMKSQIVQGTFQRIVLDNTFGKEYEKLGIDVSDEELNSLMLSDNPHPYIQSQFNGSGLVDSAGKVKMADVRKLVEKFNEQQEAQWAGLEEQVIEIQKSSKYLNLIKKGLVVTDLEAKRMFLEQSKTANVKYVVKRYTSIPDSAVTVSEDELRAYYNSHQYKYKNSTASRDIEYVSFDASPTGRDINEFQTDMKRIAEDWKNQKTPAEDSSFVMAENQNREFKSYNYAPNQIPSNEDSLIRKGVKGTVAGPVQIGASMKIYKVVDTASKANSLKIRHILVSYQGATRSTATRTKEQAKKTADSLYALARNSNANFEKFAINNSDDAVSARDTGALGWINEMAGMDTAFAKAATSLKANQVTLKETPFGFHIIQAIPRNRVIIAEIEKPIEPSPATMDSVGSLATSFVAKNTTGKLFNESIEKEGLSKGVASNIKVTDPQIRGIENPKEIIRWMFDEERKKGDVSQPFRVGKRFIVVHLAGIKEKGISPLEDVKEAVRKEAILEKKAKKLSEELLAATKGTATINDVASKAKEGVSSADNVSFQNPFIPNLGPEAELVGTISALKPNTISGPFKGTNGVYVVVVENVVEPTIPKDLTANKRNFEMNMQGRVEGDVDAALREKVNVENKTALYY